MSDDNDGHGPTKSLDGCPHRGLRLVVERRGRLIHHEDLGTMIEGARDAETLPLPTREPSAPLSNPRIETRMETCHELGQLS